MSARPSRERVTLGRAIAASVVLHVLIWLLLGWVLPGPSDAVVPDSEQEMAVTFELPPRPAETEPDLPKVPPTTEPRVEPPPDAEAEPPPPDDTLLFKTVGREDPRADPDASVAPSLRGSAAVPDAPPTDPVPVPREDRVPPTEEAPSEPQPVTPEPRREPVRPSESTPPEPPSPEGAELFETDRGVSSTPETPEPAVPEESVDVARAVREFRTPPRRLPTEPPTEDEPPGHRSGLDLPDLVPQDASGFDMRGARITFESTDYDWGDYSRTVYTELYRRWLARLLALTSRFERWAILERDWMIDHRAAVRFTILRDGSVEGIQIVSPSGVEPLDDSGASAIASAILPPLPRDFPRDRETVTFGFEVLGNVRYMKQSLEARRRAGYF